MEILKYPVESQWHELTLRSRAEEAGEVAEIVSRIIDEVKAGGDAALIDYERKFTGASLDSLQVTEDEIDRAEAQVSAELKDAINAAAANVARFHRAQVMRPIEVETAPGVFCSQHAVAIENVGLYIPGGNSPLFSTVLMLAVPARIAGCDNIVMCTPPRSDGSVHPAILYAAKVAGVHRIFKTGGAQAIAALATGTATIPKVDKIFGPGNRFVTEAKRQVTRGSVAIDMPAGPSEVLVIADGNANPKFVASDFLSQAEHGLDSQSILLTTSQELIDTLPKVIDDFLKVLPRRDMMEKSLEHSRLILLHDDEEMMRFSNAYAPEHLIINHSQCNDLVKRVKNAGSVFLGPFSPESAGDYASGTNHTLPTSGYARAFSGVNIDSFTKKITVQHLTSEGVKSIGTTVVTMAENEDLMAHRLAMALRMNQIEE